MSIRASLKVRVGEFQVDASFEFPSSGITALFGRSGSGKTTVLRCLAGLQRGVEGFLTVNDEVWLDSVKKQFVPPHRRSVGYVFQEGNLFPHLSVRENLEYAAIRAPSGKNSIKLSEVSRLLGVEAFFDRAPQRLSGGERQRVAIARSILTNPKLLLLDEPLSSLDYQSRSEVLHYLERIKETQLPMIYVSHSVEEIRRLSDRIILLNLGRARRGTHLELEPFAIQPGKNLPVLLSRQSDGA